MKITVKTMDSATAEFEVSGEVSCKNGRRAKGAVLT